MHSINEKQKASFAESSQRLGFLPDEYTHDSSVKVVPKKHEGDRAMLVISSDPEESDFRIKKVPVASIAQLKEMVGTTEMSTYSLVDYPEPLPKDQARIAHTAKSRGELLSRLNERSIRLIKNAAYAYVTGDPSKLQDYEPIVNVMYFPGALAVLIAKELIIPDNTVMVVKTEEPFATNLELIQVGINSEIKVEVDVHIKTQKFVQQ